MKKILYEIIFWTWCFPQTLLGFISSKIFNGKRREILLEGKSYVIYDSEKIRGGSVSLGKYVILHSAHFDNVNTIKHEYGHQLQSLIFGWLYMPLMAIPSMIWCLIYGSLKNVSYYSFYTEKFADFLGKVKR